MIQMTNDTISRQAALDVLDDFQSNIELGIDDYEEKRKALCDLPSAGPERMKGKWIRITQGTMPGQYMCPFCHRTIENYGIEELLSIRYPYCHCGADMRDEDHEISYGGFITTDDMLDFGYESVGDLAVAFAEFLKNNMRGDGHA